MKFTKLPKIAFTPDGRSVEMPAEPEFDQWLRLTAMKTHYMSQGLTSTEAAQRIQQETGIAPDWGKD